MMSNAAPDEEQEQVEAAGWDAVSDPNGTLTAGPRPVISAAGGGCVVVCRHPPHRKRLLGIAFRSRQRWVSCPECGRRATVRTAEAAR